MIMSKILSSYQACAVHAAIESGADFFGLRWKFGVSVTSEAGCICVVSRDGRELYYSAEEFSNAYTFML
jgi:hypothetical protein